MTTTIEDKQAAVGRRWPLELAVERGKCVEMARVLRAEREEYLSAPTLTAVPTFTVVTNHWGFSGSAILAEIGCDLTHVLHGSEEFRFLGGPLREGQRLRGEIELRAVEHKVTRGGREMTSLRFTTAFDDVDSGTRVVEVDRVILELAP